jgi:TetR/AcrR family transcriptional regulator, transcriptional repressor for nem operon
VSDVCARATAAQRNNALIPGRSMLRNGLVLISHPHLKRPLARGACIFKIMGVIYHKMRYPVQQKAETHQKIIDAAARSFREHGSDGPGIARLMKDLGLTHGGFYKHFASKEDLYVDSIRKALEESAARMIDAAMNAPKGKELRAIIEHYLSVEHLDRVGAGCVVATLAPEIARQPASVRARVNEAMRAHMNRLAPFFPGQSLGEKRQQFLVLFPSMAGVLMMARTIADRALQKEILAKAREHFVQTFASNDTKMSISAPAERSKNRSKESRK